MIFKIDWIDAGREPACPPNPNYPDGIDLDLAGRAKNTCNIELPYPAKRCGHYRVECKICGLTIGCTTAGRPDDPRSMRVACRTQGTA